VNKGPGRIETFGNKCFVDRGFPEVRVTDAEVKKAPRPKPERVNLKFGKIRVQVTCAKKVRVRQEENTMVILLSEEL